MWSVLVVPWCVTISEASPRSSTTKQELAPAHLLSIRSLVVSRVLAFLRSVIVLVYSTSTNNLHQNIREAYSFITTNYVPGDEIILIGFSRGAFTARSMAGMIRDIGLLSRGGMRDFYAIFKDFQNSRNKKYHDIFPAVPFSDKPLRGRHFISEYRERLLEVGRTDHYFNS